MRRLWARTIWAKGAIPLDERRYAGPLKWFVFPLFDAVIVWLGIVNLAGGLRAMQTTFPAPVPDLIYGLLVLTGVGAFIGCAFPQLWKLEITCKLLIFVALGILFTAMLVAAAQVEGHTGAAIAPMIVGLTLFPLLRLWLLGVEWGDRGDS